MMALSGAACLRLLERVVRCFFLGALEIRNI
jgi:hypothetical protein